MIASRKVERLESAAAELRHSQPQCKLAWKECNIRKQDQVLVESADLPRLMRLAVPWCLIYCLLIYSTDKQC